MKVRAPFLISWGYSGPRSAPCRVFATLHILRDPFRWFPTWQKAEPYQQLDTIFYGIKEGNRIIPVKAR
jgi:hypothetical protein